MKRFLEEGRIEGEKELVLPSVGEELRIEGEKESVLPSVREERIGGRTH